MRVAQDDAGSGQADHRSVGRDEIFLRTSLAVGRRTGIGAQIVNISPRGFMARTPEIFATGTTITLLLPSIGEVSARIVWSLGGRIGAEFEIPFTEAEYPALLAAIKTARPNWQLRL